MDAGTYDWEGYTEMDGTPYVLNRGMLLSALEVPCTKPPWGKLVALNLSSGEIEWERPVGTIFVDAIFSPVLRVRYKVEDTRVGQKTNYDKLMLDIWTNGTVTPEMAQAMEETFQRVLQETRKALRRGLESPVDRQSSIRACQESALEKLIDRGLEPQRARLERDLSAQLVLAQLVQAAAGVAEHDDLARAQHALAEDQRADHVVGGDPAGVAQHVRVAGPQPEDVGQHHPRVHARQDGQPGERCRAKATQLELLGVALVLGQQPRVFVSWHARQSARSDSAARPASAGRSPRRRGRAGASRAIRSCLNKDRRIAAGQRSGAVVRPVSEAARKVRGMESVIRIAGLVKSFGAVRALDGPPVRTRLTRRSGAEGITIVLVDHGTRTTVVS